jgi:hypothetical protein
MSLAREADCLEPIGPDVVHVALGLSRRGVMKTPSHDPGNIEKIV